MLLGRVDELKSGKIFGWAYNPDNPSEHVVIRINHGNQVVASGVANIVRPDLPDAGIGDGDHAFEILLPPNISSFHGLTIMAQSQRSGEVALQIATNDDRRIDELFSIFSKNYEDALVAIKDKLDALDVRYSDLEKIDETPVQSLPEEISDRLNRLEIRMESAEVFFVRIDELTRKLAEEQKKRKRKRFLGIF
ncbi:MAG: hypothetical protein JWM58_2431 [Rhizobium sp.]|nr:hypothetical protein [Rhizobium sp.]